VIAATIAGVQEYGAGATASAIVCGHTRAHEELESRLAQFMRLPRALYFSAGYMANLGIIPALLGPGDTVFSDELNHACLIDGCRLSRARVQVYPHADIHTLERLLAHSDSPRKLVATDSVFSMDDDIAPLPELLALCERYGAWLLIDDAHGFGVLGEHGRGALSHFNISSPHIVRDLAAKNGMPVGIGSSILSGDQDEMLAAGEDQYTSSYCHLGIRKTQRGRDKAERGGDLLLRHVLMVEASMPSCETSRE
jgi:8-amino-7-oxononanoate synthase